MIKKGDIIRKYTASGTFIGPYKNVLSISTSYAVVEILPFEKKRVDMAKLQTHKTVDVQKIVISHKIFERIKSGRQQAIIHDPTPAWQKLLDKGAQLIELRDSVYQKERLLFSVDNVWNCYYNRTRQIRLTLGYKLK